MLDALVAKCPEHYVYYFDIPFEETLRRHATRPIANEVGEDLLKSWYIPQDFTGYPDEVIVPETNSLEQTVRMVAEHAGLLTREGARGA